MDITLFGRYFLDLSILYPGAFLCLAPLWEHLKAPRRTALLTAFLVTRHRPCGSGSLHRP